MGGLPAVGKTFWAEEYARIANCVILDIDTYGSDIQAKEQWGRLWKDFTKFVREKKNIIIDACNHRSFEYKRYVNYIRPHDYKVRMVLVEASLDVILQRNKSRARKVNEQVIITRSKKRHAFQRQNRYPIELVQNDQHIDKN